MDKNLKKSNNNVLMLVILGALVFFLFIMPQIDKRHIEDEAKLKEKLTNTEPLVKLDKNMCSRECCKFTQWPVPHDLKENHIPEEQLKEFISSNMSCNFGSGSGCLCVKKEDLNYLSKRGGNGSV
jgi:hypothetical protein